MELLADRAGLLPARRPLANSGVSRRRDDRKPSNAASLTSITSSAGRATRRQRRETRLRRATILPGWTVTQGIEDGCPRSVGGAAGCGDEIAVRNREIRGIIKPLRAITVLQ